MHLIKGKQKNSCSTKKKKQMSAEAVNKAHPQAKKAIKYTKH